MKFIDGYKEFLQLRRSVMKILEKEMDDCHKSYEGTFEILFSYPNYFDEQNVGEQIDTPDYVKIILHCYVLGPHRHYEWTGKTIYEAVNKAKKDIKDWID